MGEAGFVGILSVDLQLPASMGLKAKRKELRRLKSALAKRFACSTAEVDHHDLWQRARLTLAFVGAEAGEADAQVEAAARWIHADPEFVVLGETRDLIEAAGEFADTWGSG
ncbi:MAG: DUF503 domain-containing protein [Miltoncostaeaceae bacterium]